MSRSKNDGQLALRASLASEWQASGLSQQESERRATQQVLALRAAGEGKQVLAAGNIVFVVISKEERQ
jgi:hypothetical protein